MKTVTLTPFDLSAAQRTGKRTFRKQILPLGTINYKGREVTFDKPFLTDLAKSFKRKAYDQVPFQVADGENRHNMDPERFRGEIKSLELTAKGLDAIIETTPAGARMIRHNPRLGVSARIVQGLEKADGRAFGRAIQHVLATMDPRVTGMTPWQTVDLADGDDTEVVDLTAASYKEGSPMGKIAKKAVTKASSTPNRVVEVKASGSKIDLSALSDEEFQALLDFASEQNEDDDEDAEDESDETDEVEDDEDETDDDDDDDESDEDDEDEDDEDDEDESTDLAMPPAFVKNAKKKKGVPAAPPETVKANLAKKKKPVPPAFAKKKKVAQVAGSTDLSVAMTRLSKNEWDRERRSYARDGVPPFLLDLASPVMSSPEAFMIDLSDDDSVDATAVIRKMLDASKGIIDIRPEVGHQIDLSEDDDDKASPTKSFLDAWDQEYGKA